MLEVGVESTSDDGGKDVNDVRVWVCCMVSPVRSYKESLNL